MGRPPQSGQRWLIATDACTCSYRAHVNMHAQLHCYFTRHLSEPIPIPSLLTPPQRFIWCWCELWWGQGSRCAENYLDLCPQSSEMVTVYSMACGWSVDHWARFPPPPYIFFPHNSSNSDRATASSSRTNGLTEHQQFFLLCSWRCIIYL